MRRDTSHVQEAQPAEQAERPERAAHASLGERQRAERGPATTWWSTLDEREGGPPARANELPEGFWDLGPAKVNRRGFFGMMGLSAAAAASACSRAPVQKVVPFLRHPEGVTPGTSLWYATTCGACPAGCGLLVKARDGRPIKIEGNPEHPLSRGGACPRGQASVLSLYDAARLRGPSIGGRPATWAALDAAVREGLAGGGTWVVAPPVLGPTAEAALAHLVAAHPGTRVVRWEPLGHRTAIAAAHEATHGARVVPVYRLDRARALVAVGADFLGAWISPVEHTRAYTEARAAGSLALHAQVESVLSLAGSKADRRYIIAPSEAGPVLAALVRGVAARSRHPGAALVAAAVAGVRAPELEVDPLAAALLETGRGALVLCGSDDPSVQALCNAVNELCGAYGETVDLEAGRSLPAGEPLDALFAALESGAARAVLFLNVNPVYAHPRGAELAALLAKAPLTVSTADRLDETAVRLGVHAPAHDPLESWGDDEPRRGLLSVRQPVLAPLFETRALTESLLAWAGEPMAELAFMQARWKAEVQPRAVGAPAVFGEFWDRAVQAGFARVDPGAPLRTSFLPESIVAAARALPPRGEGLELALFASPVLGDGALGNNGWLQELPDPLTKVTWGNAALLAPATAARLGLKDGDVVSLSIGGRAVEVPILAQPGTHPRAVGLALGHGRTAVGPVGNGVGANGFRLLGRGAAAEQFRLSPTGARRPLALSQTHNSLDGRPHVREVMPGAALEAGAPHRPGPLKSLWGRHAYPGHRWAMVVDLDACTGCAACVVSCQAENNIPVVGADEVRRRREMAWLRIDRYYSGPPDAPRVAHQPMMCQHCENAPCETVCPVLATVHSSEGLNQQVYNRCVGTRYCANNCPPKVRRFNWFAYDHGDALARMVLNPDVAVRSRGVMEKCSFCVQRIEEAKAAARAEERKLADGEVKTACQQSCPAQAIAFGDLNDPESRVAKLFRSGRAYRILDELNIGPVVTYLALVDRGRGTVAGTPGGAGAGGEAGDEGRQP